MSPITRLSTPKSVRNRHTSGLKVAQSENDVHGNLWEWRDEWHGT